MNIGTILAIVVLAGYVGLEAFTIRSASERMKPAYIHPLLIEAKTASDICYSSALVLEERFNKTLQRTSNSHREAMSEAAPTLSAGDIDQQLAQLIAASEKKVTEEVTAKGCLHPDIKAHFQRYRIYAKKS